MSDDKPDQLAKTPDQIVGRTLADLVLHTQTGPKLDAALARLAGWSIERFEVGRERVRNLFRRTDQLLEGADAENLKAIPERVGIEIMENVAREDREELFELWARLLAGSARGGDVDSYHVDTVQKLNPDSARVLLAIGDEDLPSTNASMVSYLRYERALTDLCHIEVKQAELACARLVALGLIVEKTSARNEQNYEISGFGEQLLNILYPDSPRGDRRRAFLEHIEQTSEP
jgi:hypothetical protein